MVVGKLRLNYKVVSCITLLVEVTFTLAVKGIALLLDFFFPAKWTTIPCNEKERNKCKANDLTLKVFHAPVWVSTGFSGFHLPQKNKKTYQ